jgi:glycerophosphoryl diester phosphodiesterase
VAAGHAAVHPWHPTVDATSMRGAKAAGLAVNAWTCDDPARIRQLIGWGIDGICTNVPDVGLAARSAAGGSAV